MGDSVSYITSPTVSLAPTRRTLVEAMEDGYNGYCILTSKSLPSFCLRVGSGGRGSIVIGMDDPLLKSFTDKLSGCRNSLTFITPEIVVASLTTCFSDP